MCHAAQFNKTEWTPIVNIVMPPRPDGIINVTPEEVEDARLATEDVLLVRPDGTLTPAGMLYVADTRRANATYPDSDTCTECGGILPPEGVTMVPDDGELCACPLDVWLRFDDETDEEPSHEANTYREDAALFRVEFSHTAVGLIRSRWFASHDEARTWLESEGFQDFSS